MQLTPLCSGTLIALALMLGACGQKAKYIETGGTESVVSECTMRGSVSA